MDRAAAQHERYMGMVFPFQTAWLVCCTACCVLRGFDSSVCRFGAIIVTSSTPKDQRFTTKAQTAIENIYFARSNQIKARLFVCGNALAAGEGERAGVAARDIDGGSARSSNRRARLGIGRLAAVDVVHLSKQRFERLAHTFARFGRCSGLRKFRGRRFHDW